MDIDLEHIEKKHGKELASLGMTAIGYVKMVIKSFNRVMAGSDNSLLLIVYNENLSHAAAIRLIPMESKQCWKVTTAQPRRTKSLTETDFLWKK